MASTGLGDALFTPWATPETLRSTLFHGDSDQALKTATLAYFFGAAPGGGGQIFTETGAGGMVMAGTVAPALVSVPAVSGGMVLGGAVTPAAAFLPSISGGFALGGVAVPAKVAIPAVSGGLSLSGAAPVAAIWTWTPSGGFQLGGSAQPESPYVGPVVVANPSIPSFSGGSVNVGASMGRVAARMGKLTGKNQLGKLRGKR